MNAKLFSLTTLMSGLVVVSGCADRVPSSVTIYSQAPARHSTRAHPLPSVKVTEPNAPEGHYASGIIGDYAGYPALNRFIDRMATVYGFSRDRLQGLFSQVHRQEATLRLLGPTKPSTVPPRPGGWTRYRAKFLTEKHISTGAAFWERHAEVLQRASLRYGVPPEYVMGILGVETIYGGNVGKVRVLDALTTAAFDYPRRADYFTKELENFLLMAREEGIDPTGPVGSFAGAMGLGQFMPGSFLEYAVDFDGDGHRDLWSSVDAVGSIANYFANHGWRRGEPVVTPALARSPRANSLESGLDTRYTLATLADYGILPATRATLVRTRNEGVRLLRLSTSAGDEYWLGHDNFYVITRYNHSTYYAMAVHELAQAVKQRYQATVTAMR